MTNIKISLSIILPGRQMISKEESLKQLTKTVDGKTITEDVPDFKKNIQTTLKVKDGKNFKTIRVFTRKSIPAKQVINLTEAAYDYMIHNKPFNYKGYWDKLRNDAKITVHCDEIAQALGGTVESFEILD